MMQPCDTRGTVGGRTPLLRRLPDSGAGRCAGRTVCVIDDRPRAMGPRDLQAMKDLAAIVEQELAMQRLAVDDELTGQRNRRGFDQLIG